VQDPGACLLGHAGPERDLVTERVVELALGALAVAELAGGRGEQPLREVELSDVVQPRRLAGQLAALAVDPDLDRDRKSVGGGPVGVLARAREVSIQAVEQRLAAQPRLVCLAERSPAHRRGGLRRG
jgi:hypothetical protein